MKEEVNKFYSVRSKDSQSFSIYDIRDLGEKTWRGFEIEFIDSFWKYDWRELYFYINNSR